MSGSGSGPSRSIVRSCGCEFLIFYTTPAHTNHPLSLTPFIHHWVCTNISAWPRTIRTAHHFSNVHKGKSFGYQLNQIAVEKKKARQPNLHVSSFDLISQWCHWIEYSVLLTNTLVGFIFYIILTLSSLPTQTILSESLSHGRNTLFFFSDAAIK